MIAPPEMLVAPPARLERAAYGLGNRRSIHLSYGGALRAANRPGLRRSSRRALSERDERLDFGTLQLLAAAQLAQLDHEEERAHRALLLLDQPARGGGRAAGGEQVVHDDHLL